MAKVLIIGAGVIGSIYGYKLIKSGNDITFLDKDIRLKELIEKGLILKINNSESIVRTRNFNVVSTISSSDIYDYIIITVQMNQLPSVYSYLMNNQSNNIVFMVNNPEGSNEYSKYIEEQKIIIGFPGAGGEIKDGLLKGHIVSALIQPTTIGTMNRENRNAVQELRSILKQAGFPVSVNANMNSWLINHLAMICPLGNAIYADGGDNYTLSRNNIKLKKVVQALKESFRFINDSKIGINPTKFKIILFCPKAVLFLLIKFMYNTRWANIVIFKHCMNAKDEMRVLSDGFLRLVKQYNNELPAFEELTLYNK